MARIDGLKIFEQSHVALRAALAAINKDKYNEADVRQRASSMCSDVIM